MFSHRMPDVGGDVAGRFSSLKALQVSNQRNRGSPEKNGGARGPAPPEVSRMCDAR
jgi:hypothetical protein